MLLQDPQSQEQKDKNPEQLRKQVFCTAVQEEWKKLFQQLKSTKNLGAFAQQAQTIIEITEVSGISKGFPVSSSADNHIKVNSLFIDDLRKQMPEGAMTPEKLVQLVALRSLPNVAGQIAVLSLANDIKQKVSRAGFEAIPPTLESAIISKNVSAEVFLEIDKQYRKTLEAFPTKFEAQEKEAHRNWKAADVESKIRVFAETELKALSRTSHKDFVAGLTAASQILKQAPGRWDEQSRRAIDLSLSEKERNEAKYWLEDFSPENRAVLNARLQKMWQLVEDQKLYKEVAKFLSSRLK